MLNHADTKPLAHVNQLFFKVALIDQDKSNIMDIKNKKYVRAIPMWGGSCSSDGKIFNLV